MRVRVEDRGAGLSDLWLDERRAEELSLLSEHDLRDIEFVLAQRRAMARRCTETDGEHTCGLAPGHGTSRHLCRGCMHKWPVR